MNDLIQSELARHNLALNPCPNCKSSNIEIGGDDFDGDVMCLDCRLITPVCYGTKNAILTWNEAENWKTAWSFLNDDDSGNSDTDRLNWLQSGHGVVALQGPSGSGIVFSANFSNQYPTEHKDVRIAIDKAISRENTQQSKTA